MTTIGRIQEFCPKTESFAVKHVQLFFTANDIRAKKEVPAFLNVVVNNT